MYVWGDAEPCYHRVREFYAAGVNTAAIAPPGAAAEDFDAHLQSLPPGRLPGRRHGLVVTPAAVRQVFTLPMRPTCLESRTDANRTGSGFRSRMTGAARQPSACSDCNARGE